MKFTPSLRRILVPGLAAGLAVGSVAAVPAVAAPGAPAPLVGGPFAATATASLLTIDLPAASPSLLPQTNVDVGRSTALANSADDLDTAKAGNQRTSAAAGTTGTSTTFGAPLAIQENTASAPESERNEQALFELPLEPLLNLDAVATAAEANWISDTECISADDPLSLAQQSLTDAAALPPGEEALADVTGDAEGVAVLASTSLPATGGALDRRAVAATVQSSLSGASVLGSVIPGLDDVLDVGVVEPANYTVSATGLPGGAQVVGDDPVVAVTLGGIQVVVVEAGEVEEEALLGLALGDLIGDLGLLDPLLDELQPLVRLSIPVERDVAADGTSASVSASLLRIEILPPSLDGLAQPLAAALTQALAALGLDVTEPLGVIDLAPLAAVVEAPLGGITCGGDDDDPLEVFKTVSNDPAIRGSAFDYTITVGNVGDCTLTDVVVTDIVTGPAGFDIVDTGGGTENPQGTVTWNLPDIPPDGRVLLRLRITVPAGAPLSSRFHDEVSTTADCDGDPIDGEDELDGPGVSDPTSDTCQIDGSNKATDHLEVYPGEQFAYFVNVFNSGAQPCRNVVVTDTLDARLAFVRCTDGCTANGQALRWDIGTLPAGQGITLGIIVEVREDATGVLRNTARITTTDDDPVDVTVDGPTITERSILAPPDPGTPGRPRSLARTGAESGIVLALAAGLGALALVRTRRRALPG